MGVRVFGKDRDDPLDDCTVDQDCTLCNNGISDGRQIHAYKRDAVSVSVKPMEECICDICHKSFWRKPDAESVSCPYCHSPYVMTSELEEVNVFQEHTARADAVHIEDLDPADFEVEEILAFSENWQDSRKEQISLEMGSSEYKEYLDDLANNSPDKMDDRMHVQMEEYNQDLVTKNYDAEFEDNPESDHDESNYTQDLQVRKKFEKQAIHAAVMSAAMDRAQSTKSDRDDQVVRTIAQDNLVMRDPGVSVEDYENKINEYVMDTAF